MSKIETNKEHVFEREIAPHMDALFSFSFWLTHDKEDAQDLMQDSLLKAFKYMNYYEEGTNAKSWLFRIVKNNFLNNKVKEKRIPELVDVAEVRANLGGELAHYQVHNYDYGLSDDVVHALNSLPSNLKTVFLLKYLNDFKYHEIAEMFDIPLGTVKIWLHRAKNLMKATIQEHN